MVDSWVQIKLLLLVLLQKHVVELSFENKVFPCYQIFLNPMLEG